MFRAIFAAAAVALVLLALAPAPAQLFSAPAAPVLTRPQPRAMLPPGALAVQTPRFAPPTTASVGYGLVAGGLGFSAVAMLATAAEMLSPDFTAEKGQGSQRPADARAAKEQARQRAAAEQREARARASAERRPAGADRKAAGKKRGEVAAPAPVKLTREQELAAAQEELRLARLELEQAKTKVGQGKKPVANLKLPAFELPAISLPKAGSQGTTPTDFPISDPYQGLIAGAAVGALPAAAIISLRSFLMSGRRRR